jgi:hypothetical protein
MNNFKIKSIPDKKKPGARNNKTKSSFGGNKDFRRPSAANNRKKPSKHIPAIKGETVRLITIGGFEEVGNNMYAVEYKDNI